MYRRMVLVSETVLLALLTVGCSICTLAGQRGPAGAETAMATTQTPGAGVLPTAVSTASVAPTPEVPTRTPVAVTPTRTPAPPTRTPAPTEPEAGPGAVPHEPLDALDSYRYHLVVEDVKRGQQVRTTVDGAFVREPAALQLYVVAQEGDAPAETTKFVRVQGRLYIHDPEAGGWTMVPRNEAKTENLDFVALLIEGLGTPLDEPVFWVLSAHEDVQGVGSTHYAADAHDLPSAWAEVDLAVEEGSVDVWVANDGGYIVKLSMTFTGKDEGGKPARAAFELLVFDVNEPIEVLPPPEDEIIRER